nr:hypothetical protein [Microctonus hyperodae filamentous virus]
MKSLYDTCIKMNNYTREFLAYTYNDDDEEEKGNNGEEWENKYYNVDLHWYINVSPCVICHTSIVPYAWIRIYNCSHTCCIICFVKIFISHWNNQSTILNISCPVCRGNVHYICYVNEQNQFAQQVVESLHHHQHDNIIYLCCTFNVLLTLCEYFIFYFICANPRRDLIIGGNCYI